MKHRSAALATNALISAILVAALLVGLNYLGTEHHLRRDLTGTREHSLSPQTLKTLRTLPGPILAVAFPLGDSVAGYRDMLETYAYYSKNFQYRIVDPNRNPAEAQKYKVTSYGQIILQRGSTSYTVDDASEESLTNGLLHVLQTTKKTVYVLQGEGETPLDDFTQAGMGTAKQILTGKGFDVKALVLAKESRVPEDAAAVVFPSPTKDLLPEELDALHRYYQNGGKLLVLVDPQTPAGVRAWVGSEFHVKAPGGLVIDPISQLLNVSPAVPVVAQYEFSDITKGFNLVTAFPLSTPLEPDSKAPGVTITPMFKTSDRSYIKTNLEAQDIRFQQGVDRKGPAVLAVEVTPAPGGAPGSTPAPQGGAPKSPPSAKAPNSPGPAEPPKGSAVIFGNGRFIRNNAIGMAPGNRDLFTSSVAWLTQSGNLVSIAPRASPFDAFFVTGSQGRLLLSGGVIGLPAALLIIGGSIYFRRRAL